MPESVVYFQRAEYYTYPKDRRLRQTLSLLAKTTINLLKSMNTSITKRIKSPLPEEQVNTLLLPRTTRIYRTSNSRLTQNLDLGVTTKKSIARKL